MAAEHLAGGPAIFKPSLYALAVEIERMEAAGMVDWEAWKRKKAEDEKKYWSTMDAYFQTIGNDV